MRNSSRWYCLAIIMVICLSGAGVVSSKVSSSDKLMQEAVAASGARIKGQAFNINTSIQQSGDISSLQGLISQIIHKIDAGACWQIKNTVNKEKNFVQATARNDTAQVNVQAMGCNTPNAEVFLAIMVECTGDDCRSSELWGERLQKAVDFGGNREINTCLLGFFDGKLNSDESYEKIQTVLSSVRAENVHCFKQDKFISCTGFSPLIKGGLTLGGDQVNIHVVLRYDSYDDRTYLIVGSPIIGGDY